MTTTTPARWSKRHPCCVICGSTAREHDSHGRCTLCDRRVRAGRPTHCVACGGVLPASWLVTDHCAACDPCHRLARMPATGKAREAVGIRPYHAGLQHRHRANRWAAMLAGFVCAAMDVGETCAVLLAPTEEAAK